MRILVMGAGGYLGGKISEYLAGRGHRITALVHHLPEDSQAWQVKMARVITGDANDPKILATALGEDYDSTIFAISLDHQASELDYAKTLTINVGIYWKLLEMCPRKTDGRIIYLSTQQVYGRYYNSEIISERTPLNPANIYGLTHQYCEELGSLYSREKGIRCINLRISNGYGAPAFNTDNGWRPVINELCKMAVEKGEIRLQSDGTPQRDFIAVADICQAIEMVIAEKPETVRHEIYNLGSGQTRTILEAAHEIAEICIRKYRIEIPVILPGNEISQNVQQHKNTTRFSLDIRRIKALGFRPNESLKSGVEEVLDFLKKA